MQLRPNEYLKVGWAASRPSPHILRVHLATHLPGVEDHEFNLGADVDVFDEVTALLSDFHNEWRTWGNLTDRVLDDWSTLQYRLPI